MFVSFSNHDIIPSSVTSGQVVSLTVDSFQGGKLALWELAAPPEESERYTRARPRFSSSPAVGPGQDATLSEP